MVVLMAESELALLVQEWVFSLKAKHLSPATIRNVVVLPQPVGPSSLTLPRINPWDSCSRSIRQP